MVEQNHVLRRLKEIERHISRSKLIDKIIHVAREHGEYNTAMHSSHTKVEGRYSGRGLFIDYVSGCSMMGGGSLSVRYVGSLVFFAEERHQREDLLPYVGNHTIQKYIPGKWEEKVIALSKEKKEKPKKSQKKQKLIISPAKLEELAEAFALK